MYNCFSNNPTRNVIFNFDGKTFSSYSNDYTIYAIPARFGKKYTVALDWFGSVEVFSGFYSSGVIVPTSINSDYFNTSTYKKYTGMRFNHPVVYDCLDFNNLKVAPDFFKESCLKLFLVVPNTCKSTIVVLEGDYLKNTEIFINKNKEQELGSKVPSKVDYVSRLQLLYLNTTEKYMLADRLVEFLSNNAINPNDDIVENIKRLQRKLFYDGNALLNNDSVIYNFKIDNYGIWNDSIREFLYLYARKYKYTNKLFDITGYLDKDLEYYIDLDNITNGAYVDNGIWNQVQ